MPSRRRFLQQSALMMSGAAWAAGEPEAMAESQALVAAAQAPAAQPASEFDVIIVGAGSSGCVLANRLTAHPQTRVPRDRGGRSGKPIRVHPVPGQMDVADRERRSTGTSRPSPNRARGPAGEVASRQGLRRVELDQRHGLCARPSVRASTRGPSTPVAAWSYRELLPRFRRPKTTARRVGISRERRCRVGLRHGRPHAGHLAFLEAARSVDFGAAPSGTSTAPARSRARASIRRTSARVAGIRQRPPFSCPSCARPNLTVVAEHAGAAPAGRRTPRDGDRGAAEWCPRTRARDA